MMMMKIKWVISILCVLTLTAGMAQSIDREKSTVNFEVDNFLFNTVEGSFNGVSGSILFKPSDLKSSSFSVCIDASTINTENGKRDNHLKSEDFFEVENYPSICFNSESIEKTKSGYLTKGKLRLHGISKNITIPFSFDGKTFTGTFKLNRLDYQLGKETGTFMVSEEVVATIHCHVK